MTTPHPTLRRYYARDRDRHAFVTALFDRSARHYELINTGLSLGFGLPYRRLALERAGLVPGMRVLDVATGTGLVARAAETIVGDGRRVIGLDPSQGMLAEARARASNPVVLGVGERLPFAAASFELLCMGYALRHLPDLEQAFAEYFRVLRPGGRVLILEISRPASRVAAALTRWCLGVLAPRLTRLVTGSPDAQQLTRYYWETIAECVPRSTILDALRASGFREVALRTHASVLSEFTARKG